MFLSISEQHDYNKNIFIYINNQFMHFLPALNVHLWYQFDVGKESGGEEKKGERRTPENSPETLKMLKCLKNRVQKCVKKVTRSQFECFK